MGFTAIAAAVRQAIETGRIGIPVSARLLLHTVKNADDIPPLMANVLTEALAWFAAKPHTVWASGDVRSGHWTVLVRLTAGQSLIVSVGKQVTELPVTEVVLFGNHGTLSCEGGSALTQTEDRSTLHP